MKDIYGLCLLIRRVAEFLIMNILYNNLIQLGVNAVNLEYRTSLELFCKHIHISAVTTKE